MSGLDLAHRLYYILYYITIGKAAMPRSIRFDDATEARLQRAARRQNMTTSDYVRSAVRAQLERDEPATSSWELLKDFCGKFDSGDPDLSQRDPGEIIRAKYNRSRVRRERRTG